MRLRSHVSLLALGFGLFPVFGPLAFNVTPACAQTPPAAIPRVDLDEAVRRALASNPTVAQAATTITRSELLVQQARSITRPTIGARLNNSTIDKEVAFSAGVAQPQNQTTIVGDFSMPILDLSRWGTIAQARDQIDVSRLATDTTRRDVAYATAQAYLAVIVSRRQVDVDERAVENAHAHLDYARKRLEGGAGTRLNELRAAAAASSSEARLENSRFSLRRAQEALGVLLAADTPIDASSEPVFDTPSGVNEQEWAQARPDVRLQQSTQRAAERIVRDSWRDWMGAATATFSPQIVAPAGLFQPARTWRLTVSFAQPIFEGGQRKAVLRLRELQVEQTKIGLSSTLLRARSEVRVAEEAVRSSQRALDTSRQAASQAADVLRITTSAFELGATTNIEVIDAQRATRDADSAAALAEDALRRARLDYLVAIGRFPR